MNTSRFLARCFLAAIVAVAPALLGGCSDDPSTGDEQDVTSAAGRFETFKGADGKFYFHLLAGNYEKVLHSQGYTTLASAKKGVESVKANGVSSKSYKILEAANGEYYFNLVAANGKIIGTSETYDSRSNAVRGSDTVRELVAKQLRIEAAETGGARFDVFEGSDGDSYFHLRAGNGEIVLQSEGYASESGAVGAIDSVRTNGADLERYELVEADYGQAYFRLTSSNGAIIGRSEIYVSLYNAERGLDAVQALIASEKVADPE